MSGTLQGYKEYEPEETLEEEPDEIEWLFITTPEGQPIVLHHPECAYYSDSKVVCDCIPQTLIRGAKA